MKENKGVRIPKFESLAEERKYWEARGPLAEEHKGKINKPKPGQRRSSFLAVRLTGEELTRLRDTAAKQGLGPSTFARLVLTRAIENESGMSKAVTSDEIKDLLDEHLPQLADVIVGKLAMTALKPRQATRTVK